MKAGKIKVLDLFAGPGGLGEGFARFSPNGRIRSRPFDIVFSAESDPSAVCTLRLRSFYRMCEEEGHVPESYFNYLRGESRTPHDLATEVHWKKTMLETHPVQLGTDSGNRALERALKSHIRPTEDWILIGGPPCQAYSLVGRSRNKGIADYCPEKDSRNFLYEHYLAALARYQPIAFVMENVKGLLSSKVGSEQMFPRILRDLANPGKAANARPRPRYHLYALASSAAFSDGDNISDIEPSDFLVRSEDFGIPQTRHRVILVGVRQDAGLSPPKPLKVSTDLLSVDIALRTLPPLRSDISRRKAPTTEWQREVNAVIRHAENNGLSRRIAQQMRGEFNRDPATQAKLTFGGRFVASRYIGTGRSSAEKRFLSRITSRRTKGYSNHEARSHMPLDLGRYLFASTFARYRGQSPKAKDFPSALAPQHRNWSTGKFSDRFRVQIDSTPSTTITSHISKDGHYYIHPDPIQCRSLTVREAARLQSFPDDYFFEGNRTRQFVQVGNAVPPMLALRIAEAVWRLISEN